MTKARSQCPINASVELLGGKWTLLILRDVLLHRRHSYGQLLQNNPEGISAPMLARRLKGLVAAGFLEKSQVGRGEQGRYSPTEKAVAVVPVLVALAQFGARYYPETSAAFPPEFASSEAVAVAMQQLRAGISDDET